MKQLSAFILSLVFLASCNREMYQTSSYEAYAPAHNTVAVLPVKTITTGRVPVEWTDEMIDQVEENESEAFQIALFDEVNIKSGNQRGDVQVSLQHYTDTNAKLKAAGYTIRQSWDMPASDLAAILGVDAVIRSSVKKEVFLTDMESLGLDVAVRVLAAIDGSFWGLNALNKTSEVYLSASILDANDGVVIWSTRQTCQTDWNQPHETIVRNLARTLARRFPYREMY